MTALFAATSCSCWFSPIPSGVLRWRRKLWIKFDVALGSCAALGSSCLPTRIPIMCRNWLRIIIQKQRHFLHNWSPVSGIIIHKVDIAAGWGVGMSLKVIKCNLRCMHLLVICDEIVHKLFYRQCPACKYRGAGVLFNEIWNEWDMVSWKLWNNSIHVFIRNQHPCYHRWKYFFLKQCKVRHHDT